MKFPENKSSEWDGFTREFYQGNFLKLFQNIDEDGKLPKSFWGYHYPDIKTRQRYCKKRKLQANIFNEYRYKNPQQNISKPNQQ